MTTIQYADVNQQIEKLKSRNLTFKILVIPENILNYNIQISLKYRDLCHEENGENFP